MSNSATMAQDTAAAAAAPSSPASAAPAAPATQASVPPAKAAASPRRRFIIIGVLALIASAGVAYWAHARHYVETDDAQIDGSISNVSPRVSGNVIAVYVVENQMVKEGDVLAEIDPVDLQIAVDQAKAAVAQAQAQFESEDPSVPIVEAIEQERGAHGAVGSVGGGRGAVGGQEGRRADHRAARAGPGQRTAPRSSTRSGPRSSWRRAPSRSRTSTRA